jgi:hypothetical protein
VLLALSASGADMTAWNLAFKMSRGPQAPAFLASTSLVRALATGSGPIVGGTLALLLRGQSVVVAAPVGGQGGTVLLNITRFPLLFFAGAVLIMASGAVLTRVKEEGEAPRSALLDALRLEADDGLMPGVRHFAAATTLMVRSIVGIEERASASFDSGMDALRGAIDAAREPEGEMETGPPGPRGR